MTPHSRSLLRAAILLLVLTLIACDGAETPTAVDAEVTPVESTALPTVEPLATDGQGYLRLPEAAVRHSARYPRLVVSDPVLGQETFWGPHPEAVRVTVPAGQELHFTWQAHTPRLRGWVSTRYGWNVVDYADPNDPGWMEVGGPELTEAPPRSFQQGSPSFVVEVTDHVGRTTRALYYIQIVQDPR